MEGGEGEAGDDGGTFERRQRQQRKLRTTVWRAEEASDVPVGGGGSYEPVPRR